ncbi:hypothetical protein WJM97_01700 [Okeanomitos corallinicola TIOX110]|uniref:Uncharacterized protein n=1 Tax=Okeanomitos corallinicola TIOX110 TaxID=3133117 RepID=A0ABZ2UW59_9CYAN
MQQQIQRIKKYNTIFPFVGLRKYPNCHIFAADPLPPFSLPTFTQVVTAANGKHQAVLLVIMEYLYFGSLTGTTIIACL